MSELIPSIDLRGGQVVRLMKGDDARRTVYAREPRQLLEEFAAAGVRLVHMVDLDAAFGEPPQRAVIAALAASSPVALELGGGLRDEASLAWAFDVGIERAVLGSMVARDLPGFLSLTERFPQRLVPAVEVADGELKVAGWVESAPIGLETLCRALSGAACPAVLVTDVGRDGTLEGPNLDLARRVAELSGLPALVSGGVRSLEDLRLAASMPKVGGIIVGRAFYEGLLTLPDAVAAVARASKASSRGDA